MKINNHIISLHLFSNKWNNKKWMLLLLLPSYFLNSCDSFVEVGLPNSQLTSQGVFEDKATANAAMVDIYNKIRDNGLLTGNSSGISNQLGNYTDELICYGSTASASIDFYNNALVATNSNISGVWNGSYNQIYGTNSVLEGVKNALALPASDRDQLTGEALFVRALIHLYLTNLFGDIPYITTTDYKQNNSPKRIPQTEVYDKIKTDLKQAIELLPESYVSTEKVRPNKYAAIALLARVDLYSENWAEALENASKVISNTTLYKWTSLDKVFLKNSTTTIWQLMPAVKGKNTFEGETFIFTAGPPPLTALSSGLMDAFSMGDLRKSWWTKAVTNGTDTWYHAYKYKEFQNTVTSLEYSIILRLAEQYLIRAEAKAHLNDALGASQDLNAVRNQAGLGNTTAITIDELLEAVLKERRLEFFTEFGHRFFDLKRTNTLDSALTGVKLGWDAKDHLWPIPATELAVNPNLRPQNPGY
ncbi:RagB/SusD family nutrient uptake outer membrane protein [Flavobacterium eburneipallidum]|uniref:RagB/SusD family nutrient uptake outer membrane protein n=1 Tax=Flavobacterium eburneipallidum TaxID=3003263 RepID=UPI0024827E3D|nr:RagB/SusD family nutrient uptake outer membrane protein [Flavobacterium eburneipallidum]